MFHVILDLLHFFDNHKRRARVFIKENIKTIADLHNKITDIFGVKDFYLCTGENHSLWDSQQYLPPQEDIRVLSNQEVVCVIPKEKPKQTIADPFIDVQYPTTSKLKNPKRHLEVISEETLEEVASCPKKKTRKNEADSTSEEELSRKKKKKKHHKEHFVKDGVSKESFKKSKSKCTKEDLIVNTSIETSVEKPKSDRSKLNSLLPTLKYHINSCDNTGRSMSSNFVRLSNHVDTPFKNFKKMEPIPTITDEVLTKKKVNIVKIDIIKQAGEVLINGEESPNNLTTNSNIESLSFSTPKHNFVKNDMESIEKENSLSLEQKSCAKNSQNLESNENSKCFSPIEKARFNKTCDSELMELDHEITDKGKSSYEFSCQPTNNSTSQSQIRNSETNIDETVSSSGSQNSFQIKQPEFISQENNDKNQFEDSKTSVCSVALKNNAQIEKSLDNSMKSSTEFYVSMEEENKKSVNSSLISTRSNISFGENEASLKTNGFVGSKTNNSLEFNSSASQIMKPYNQSTSNISSDVMQTPSPSYKSTNDSAKKETLSDNKNYFYMKRKLAGMASCLEQLKESNIVDNPIEQNLNKSNIVKPIEQDSFNNFVTKRHRKRNRTRQSKKSRDCSEASTSDTSFAESFMSNPRPLNVSACPKIHVKFTDEPSNENIYIPTNQLQDTADKSSVVETNYKPSNENILEQISTNHFKDTAEQSSVNKTDDQVYNSEMLINHGVNNSQEPQIELHKACLNEEDILKCPIILESNPKLKEGNIVAFKMLSMKGFNPIITDYIVGRVMEFSDDNVVNFQILSGDCPSDTEYPNSNYRKYPWKKLIAPRMVFP